jgi:CubicO group peptidase (beta-lactamase class C family)
VFVCFIGVHATGCTRVARQPVVGPRGPDYTAVIAAIDDRIPAYMEQNSVPGVAIALVDGDAVVWSKGYGLGSDSLAVTDTTIFSVQSISKTYTASVVLRAVELGWLSLDDPLIKYLPEFTVRSRFGPDQAGKVTIRHLLAHRACLPHEAPVGSNFDDSKASWEDHTRSIFQSWLLCEVGSRYSYSNLGYDLAGRALEQIAGRPFAAIVDSVLLRPLGMRRSTFDFNEVQRLGGGTDGHAGARTLPLQRIPMIPSGGLYSTARDMARFVAYMITQGQSNPVRVLSAAHIALMGTPQFAVPGQTAGYGLGLHHVPAFGAVRFSQSGGGFGFSAEHRWIPEYGVGVVVLMNQQNASASAIAAGVLQLMLRAKLGAEPAAHGSCPTPPESSGRMPIEHLRRFEGEYKSGSLVTFSVRNGRLHLIAGNDTTELVERDSSEFVAGCRIYRFSAGGSNGTGVQVVDPNYADNGAEFWPLNRSPSDPLGPSRPEWTQYVGEYENLAYGGRTAIRIELRDGYLYTSWHGGLRLTEFGPGLLATPEGEVLEFPSGGDVLVANRRFRRSRSRAHATTPSRGPSPPGRASARP